MADASDKRPKVSDFLDNRTAEDFEAQDEMRFESAVVEYLLRHYRVPAKVKFEMLNEHAAQEGFKTLRLEAFHERFPDFPVQLFAKKFRKLRETCPVHKLFEKFDATPFAKAYVDLEEEFDEELFGSYALIFHWPYLKQCATSQGGALVLHQHADDDSEATGVRLTFYGDAVGADYYLDPLWRFLAVAGPVELFDSREGA